MQTMICIRVPLRKEYVRVVKWVRALSLILPEVLRSFSFLFADDLKIVNCSSKADDLSADMHTAALWASQWDMEFSWTKCKTMHFGRGQAPILAVTDEQGSHELERVNSFKDLGVIHTPDMKHHEQVDVAVAKARSAAYLIKRVFHHLTPTVFLLHPGLVFDNFGRYGESRERTTHGHQAGPGASIVPIRGKAGDPGALLHEETPTAGRLDMGFQDLKRQSAPRPEQLVHLKIAV